MILTAETITTTGNRCGLRPRKTWRTPQNLQDQKKMLYLPRLIPRAIRWLLLLRFRTECFRSQIRCDPEMIIILPSLLYLYKKTVTIATGPIYGCNCRPTLQQNLFFLLVLNKADKNLPCHLHHYFFMILCLFEGLFIARFIQEKHSPNPKTRLSKL